jgi:hypothetical protein
MLQYDYVELDNLLHGSAAATAAAATAAADQKVYSLSTMRINKNESTPLSTTSIRNFRNNEQPKYYHYNSLNYNFTRVDHQHQQQQYQQQLQQPPTWHHNQQPSYFNLVNTTPTNSAATVIYRNQDAAICKMQRSASFDEKNLFLQLAHKQTQQPNAHNSKFNSKSYLEPPRENSLVLRPKKDILLSGLYIDERKLLQMANKRLQAPNSKRLPNSSSNISINKIDTEYTLKTKEPASNLKTSFSFKSLTDKLKNKIDWLSKTQLVNNQTAEVNSSGSHSVLNGLVMNTFRSVPKLKVENVTNEPTAELNEELSSDKRDNGNENSTDNKKSYKLQEKGMDDVESEETAETSTGAINTSANTSSASSEKFCVDNTIQMSDENLSISDSLESIEKSIERFFDTTENYKEPKINSKSKMIYNNNAESYGEKCLSFEPTDSSVYDEIRQSDKLATDVESKRSSSGVSESLNTSNNLRSDLDSNNYEELNSEVKIFHFYF